MSLNNKNLSHGNYIFICFGRQTKQIMVAKFQTLYAYLLNQKVVRTPRSGTYLSKYSNAKKIRGDKDCQVSGALIFKPSRGKKK
jgi:hypothetical protein